MTLINYRAWPAVNIYVLFNLAESRPGGRERYWDTVPLKYFLDDYTVYTRKCDAKDVIEIDTFTELKALGKAYDI